MRPLWKEYTDKNGRVKMCMHPRSSQWGGVTDAFPPTSVVAS